MVGPRLTLTFWQRLVHPTLVLQKVLTKTIQMAKADKADMFSFGRVLWMQLVPSV